jgi:MoxR-like ATPase
MTTPSDFNYSFSKTAADYSPPKGERTDEQGRCYEPYIPSDGLVEAVQLAIELQRPILLEGEPGCGKTRLAAALIYQLTQNNLRGGEDQNDDWWPFYIWTVKSSTRARDGLYSFDAIGRLRDAQMASLPSQQESKQLDKIQNPKSYRTFGPLGKALHADKTDENRLKGKRAVLLIDEVDKADSDFANDLLLELDEFRFEIPETEESITPPEHSPIVILTSNREKPLPEAFLRRCLYFHINFPEGDELKEIARNRLANLRSEEQPLIDRATEVFEKIRKDMTQPGSRPPGTSEFLEFLTALRRKSEESQTLALEDLRQQLPLLGILLKTKTDQEIFKKAEARRVQAKTSQGET